MNVGARQRVFVTGTDTDVGKTRVSAALARATADAGSVTIVKAVQTGVEPGVPADAEVAGALASCSYAELARFRAPADPWSAALAENNRPIRAQELVRKLADLKGMLVIEGAGGIAVPLNADETFADLIRLADCQLVVVVGLRLGCINHARLTLAFARQAGIAILGAVLCERWGPVAKAYHEDVTRALSSHVNILAAMPFEPDAAASVAAGARLIAARYVPTKIVTSSEGR